MAIATDLTPLGVVDPLKFLASTRGTVHRLLAALRTNLGMDVGYVSEFVDDQSVFRSVDAPGLEAMIKVGDAYSVRDVYCRHVLEGRLPEFIPDTAVEPIAMAMPITQSVPIGTHASVPIKLDSGKAYGMLCCLGFTAKPGFSNDSRGLMRAIADVIGTEISGVVTAARLYRERHIRIDKALAGDELTMAFQPIWNIATRQLFGFEGLARFAGKPQRPPDQWFAEAEKIGLRTRLEVAAIRQAASSFTLPTGDLALAVNVSPQTVLHRSFQRLMDGLPLDRMILEITEHALVDNYERLAAALQCLRDKGLQIAIDDAGAGFASLRHVLLLKPDIIKLDASLIRDIDTDTARQAAVTALAGFAAQTECKLIAEALETPDELRTVQSLGVRFGQGYLLGAPMQMAQTSSRFEKIDERDGLIREAQETGRGAFERSGRHLSVVNGNQS